MDLQLGGKAAIVTGGSGGLEDSTPAHPTCAAHSRTGRPPAERDGAGTDRRRESAHVAARVKAASAGELQSVPRSRAGAELVGLDAEPLAVAEAAADEDERGIVG